MAFTKPPPNEAYIELPVLCNPQIDGPFWASNRTIWTHHPVITICFEYAGLRTISPLFLLLLAPLHLFALRQSYLKRMRAFAQLGLTPALPLGSWLLYAKIALSIILAIINIIELVKFWTNPDSHGAIYLLSPVLDIISFLSVAFISCIEFRVGLNSSGVLTIFWFIELLASAVRFEFGSVLNEGNTSTHRDGLRIALVNLTLLVVLVQCVLQALADNACLTPLELYGPGGPDDYSSLDQLDLTRPIVPLLVGPPRTFVGSAGSINDDDIMTGRRSEDNQSNERTPLFRRRNRGSAASSWAKFTEDLKKRYPPCPEVTGSFLNRISFTWVTGLLVKGFRKLLTEDDCSQLKPSDRATELASALEKSWTKELQATLNLQLREFDKVRHQAVHNGVVLENSSDHSINSGSVQEASRPNQAKGKGIGQNQQSTSTTSSNHDQFTSQPERSGPLGNGYLGHENQRTHASTFTPPRYSLASGVQDSIDEGTSLHCLRSMHQEILERNRKDPQIKVVRPSILRTIKPVVGSTFFISGTFKLCSDLITFVQPMLLDHLISVLTGVDQYRWHGYALATMLLIVIIVRTYLLNLFWHYGYVVGIQLRASLSGLIYRKAMRLSASGRKESTTGEVVNLLSSDMQRCQDVPPFLHYLWSSPLMIGIAVTMLWMKIGIASLAGLLLMVAMIPINVILVSKVGKLTERQMHYKDERVKLSTEVLNGIKVLKLYGWERAYQNRIEEIRGREMKALRAATYLSACASITWFCAPFLVALTSFALFIAISPSHVLDANTAFVCMNLINILGFPMSLLPASIAQTIQLRVAARRILDYLCRDELAPNTIRCDSSSRTPINLVDCSFSWGPVHAPVPILQHLNLTIRHGELIAIVGQVGSGKTSLLNALLGEMIKCDGDITVNGSLAYVPQEAWILNMSLRQNIVFGRGRSRCSSSLMSPRTESFCSGSAGGSVGWSGGGSITRDDEEYKQVLGACALERDLDLLPYGDETEIGERGINLSGGQKQRVSLARAAYLDADLYLLDDPLSAVDAHVAKHIFDQLIGRSGLLAKKTRVLVTHQLHLLPEVDRVLVLRDGRVEESGTFDELMSHNGPFAQFALEYLVGAAAGVSRPSSATNQAEAEQEETDVDGDGEAEPSAESSSTLSTTPESNLLGPEHKAEQERANSERSEFESKLKDQLMRLSISEKSYEESENKRSGWEANQSVTSNMVPALQAHLGHESGANTRRKGNGEGGAAKASKGKSGTGTHHRARRRAPSGTRRSNRRNQLVIEESSQQGSVRWAVYWAYCAAMGWKHCIVIGITFVLFTAASIATNLWLSLWTDDAQCNLIMNDVVDENETYWDTNYTQPNLTACAAPVSLRLGVYGALVLAQTVVILVQSLAISHSMCHGAQVLHARVLHRVLRSPLAFFERTPIGRIANRLSRDVDALDVLIPQSFRFYLVLLALVLCTLGVIAMSGFLTLAVLLPLILAFLIIQRLYISPSRQLMRFETVLKSPMFAHFQSSISGLASIRAYRMQEPFIRRADRLVDRYHRVYYPKISSFRWLSFSLDSLSALTIFAIAFIAIVRKDILSPGLSGLAITYALQIANLLGFVVRTLCELENYIVSVERLNEYSQLQSEAPLETREINLPQDWPYSGRIEFVDYCLRYREGLDLALKNLSLSVQPRERVGIVGRTGAGKSSLSLALFRIVEAAAGHILIDGVDISLVGLEDLRTSLTIIPQDPVLFSGTLRQNLDPLGKYPDEAVWRALEQANLAEHVRQAGEGGASGGLDMQCSEGGENLSVGQRQLVCLARALLRHSRVLVLDEATAAVDLETDDAIQDTIRTQFKECTVLTIAHRLNTVLDYNRILVLDHGSVIEFDSPDNLLANPSTVFYSMAQDAGISKD